MSKTKEFLINFQERFEGSDIDRLRAQLEAEEKEWYLSQRRQAWIDAAENLDSWNG